MNLVELTTLYAIVGAGSAVALLARTRRDTEVLDLFLLLTLWPLFGPFLMMREVDEERPGRADATRAAAATRVSPSEDDADFDLRGAAVLLEDGDGSSDGGDARPGVRDLEQRLERARSRRDALDELLARPRFDADSVEARCAALREQGATRAAVAASRRLEMIERLRELRREYDVQLTEIRELVAQLHVQTELVRIAGRDADTDRVIDDLVERVEELDAMLEVEDIVRRERAVAAPDGDATAPGSGLTASPAG
jgi:hypothetical protein